MKKFVVSAIAAAAFVTAFAMATPAQAEPKFGILGAPFQTWGEFSVGEREGVKFDTRLEQGLTIAQFGPQDRFKVVPFVGVRATLSNRHDETWNNRIGEDFGVKLTYDVPAGGPLNWGQLAIGVKGEHFNHLDGRADRRVDQISGVVFVQYGFGGNWLKK